MKKQITILCVALLSLIYVDKSNAQRDPIINQVQEKEYLDLIYNPKQSTTLADVQRLAESYFADRDKGRGSGYKQYKRWEYKMERMVNADGRFQNFSKLTWSTISKNNVSAARSVNALGDWTPLGPLNYTNGASGYNGGLGRVNVIAFHPTDANTIYLGTPAGGVWKSTTGGANWTPMADELASIGVSGIAVDHSAPNTVYILTGDGDGGHTFSIGVLKSTNGGVTWNTTGLSFPVTNFTRGYKLLMHPTNSDIMFAVTTIGILKTTDGWATWTTEQAGNFRDMEFKPGDPTTVYASTTNTFYKSTDTGNNWSVISAGLPTGESRSELAVTPANPNYVYYLSGGSSAAGTYKGTYRSTDSGANFSTMSTTPNILGYPNDGSDGRNQAGYDLAIAANPNDADNIITGGINVWRSTNGGTSLTSISKWSEPKGVYDYVHADIHELVYNPLDGTLYVGSDGGISKSTNNGVDWTNIWTGLQIAQYYKISGVEANPNLLITGAQDNGSNKYTGSTTIQHIYGADGMDNMIDYNNNNIIYYSFQNGGLRKSTNGGSTGISIKPPGSTGSWVTPYVMDASNPNIIYGGYSDVYRSTNQGSTWTNIGSDGRGALAVGVNDPARLYAANGSSLQTSANTGGSWTTISGSLPGLTITAIALDPNNASRVWVSLGGYTAGQKVYESADAGASWVNISNALPNTPVLSIVYQNTNGNPMDALYIGTSLGVYYTSDTTPWTELRSGLPKVPVFDLEINHANGKIRAGTFGRGLWEANLFDDTVPPTITCAAQTTPIECPAVPVWVDPIVTDNQDPNPRVTFNDVTTPKCGKTYSVTRTWTAVDNSGNQATCSKTIEVIDTTPPDAPAAPADVDVQCAADVPPPVNLTANDNCDGDITVSPSAVITPGNCDNQFKMVRTWTFEDKCGNSSSVSQTINVNDDTPPTIDCPANPINLPGCNPTRPTMDDAVSSVVVDDNCGIKSVIANPGPVIGDCYKTQIFNVVVTDLCGNTANCDVTYTWFEDFEAPIVTAQHERTFEMGCNPNVDGFPTGQSFIDNGFITVTDNCNATLPEIVLDRTEQINIGCKNFLIYYYKATDDCGNTTPLRKMAKVTYQWEEDDEPTCEVAFARYKGTDMCFADDSDSNSSQTGWTNYFDAPGEYTMQLYAGVSDCDVINSENVGKVMVDYTGSFITLNFIMYENYVMGEAYVNIGCEKYPLDNSGQMTTDSDHFNYRMPDLEHVRNYTVGPIDISQTNGVYVIAEAVTCLQKCDCSVSPYEGGSYILTAEKAIVECRVADGEESLSINDSINSPTFKAYPVPFENDVFLEYKFNYETDVTIEVFDLKGALIKRVVNKAYNVGTTTKTKLDFSNLSDQLYFVKLKTNKGIGVKKLVSN